MPAVLKKTLMLSQVMPVPPSYLPAPYGIGGAAYYGLRLCKIPFFQRFTRALPFFMMDSTSSLLAMLVSPGVVMAKAPWAAP